MVGQEKRNISFTTDEGCSSVSCELCFGNKPLKPAWAALGKGSVCCVWGINTADRVLCSHHQLLLLGEPSQRALMLQAKGLGLV